jgi:ABC-type sugar transport systems, permease components
MNKKDNKIAFYFLLPSLVLFGLFVFYPMIKTGFTSLYYTNTGGERVSFAGLGNYAQAFSSSVFRQGFKATILFVLLTVPLTVIISFFLAYLTSEKIKGSGFFRLVFSSTMGISVAVSSIFWMFLFNPVNGYLNRFLGLFGLQPVEWLTDPRWAIFAVAIVTIWQNTGFAYIIFLGGLQGIDSSLLEAASIQGVKESYLVRKLIIPLLSPTFYFIITISIIQAFQAFGQIDMLTKGGPNNTTDTLVYQVYQDSFLNLNSGRASAEAIILFVIILIVTVIQSKFSESKVNYQ